MCNQGSHIGITICVSVLAMCAGLHTGAQKKGASPQKPGSPTANQERGFYCNLKALSPAERMRHKQLTEKIQAARKESKELPDGYAFRMQPNSVSLEDLAEWVSAERKCCPFFNFDIALESDGGPPWLKLTGKDGIKQFIGLEFGL